jgi:DNA uptake protein ComE-like DNA-binding protein
MAKRAQAAKRPAKDPWVPPDLGPGTSRKSSRKSGDTDEWLPIPKPGANGERNGESEANGNGNGNGFHGAKADGAVKPHRRRRRHRLPKRASPRERWLILRLRRSRRRVDELREVIEHLKQRVAELEAEAEAEARTDPEPSPQRASTPKRAAAKPARKSEARPPKRARTAKPSAQRRSKPASNGNGARKRSTKLDLNKATFDELRDLGLSVNQTSRLISYRERDGFASVDDLEEIPGLARATVTKLRSQVRVATR